MPMKLMIALAKKVGLPRYGSLGATCGVELESPDLGEDPDGFRRRVRAAFPTHGFSGEEYGDAPGDRHRWYLDPVDGTTNLANGIPWTK